MTTQAQPLLARIVLEEAARAEIDRVALKVAPYDIYRQTVLVTGIDPLGEMMTDEPSAEVDE